MKETLKKLRDKKGFTLVELIVVLVILAILAALLIPTLTGYINKANKEKLIANTRMVTMAVQSSTSSLYGTKGEGGKIGGATTAASDKAAIEAEVTTLSEIDLAKAGATASVNADAKITCVAYTESKSICIYDGVNKTYTVYDTEALAAAAGVAGYAKPAVGAITVTVPTT